MDNYNPDFLEACDELLVEKDEDAVYQWNKAGRIVGFWLRHLFNTKKKDA